MIAKRKPFAVYLRLVSVMRSRAHRGKTMDEWRKEQLAWLLDPVRQEGLMPRARPGSYRPQHHGGTPQHKLHVRPCHYGVVVHPA